MKKILALTLAMLMLLAMFAGCASKEEAAEAPAEESAAVEEAPVEEAPAEEAAPAEFTWNGQKEVWSILPTTGAEGLVWINDAMGAIMEAEGFTYVKKDAQGDPTAQVSFVEDAIAAGNVGALMIAAMSVDMLEEVVIKAQEAGIAVAMLGAEPTNYTIGGCVYTAYEITGMFAVQAAEHWVQTSGANVPKNADGKYEVAIDTYYDIADGVYRSNAIRGTVEKSDVLALVSETTSYGNSAYSTAFDNASDVLNANPDCHIFIAYEPEEAMGAADAIADYVGQNGGDLADYCVIPCYAEDSAFTAMYEEVAADPSANAIKGYATYGDPAMPYGDEAAEKLGKSYAAVEAFSKELMPDLPIIFPPVMTGQHLAEILLGTCGIEGYTWNYGETYYDTITAVTVDGFNATWSMGDENPAAEYKVLD
ncbi:MAG: sugar ABC transporter substrate-binding protein [Ruminococcaceae bacterium]|nr:sugar ABC transporter substrate-binding protein [Oscillospiraceae bacterium]